MDREEMLEILNSDKCLNISKDIYKYAIKELGKTTSVEVLAISMNLVANLIAVAAFNAMEVTGGDEEAMDAFVDNVIHHTVQSGLKNANEAYHLTSTSSANKEPA